MKKTKQKITEAIKTPLEKGGANIRQILQIPVDEIIPDPDQPRQTYYSVDGIVPKEEQQALEELALSIKDKGVIQPILLMKLDENKYKIIVGERRWRASKMAGLKTIPAEVREPLDSRQIRVLQITENIQREDMSDLDTARFLNRIIETDGIPRQQLAKELGKNPSYISRMLGFLDEKYQYLVDTGIIKSASVLEQFKSLTQSIREDLIAEARASGESIKLAMIQRARQEEAQKRKDSEVEDDEEIFEKLLVQNPEVASMLSRPEWSREMPDDEFAQTVQNLQKEFEGASEIDAEAGKENELYKPFISSQMDASNDNAILSGMTDLPPLESSGSNTIEVVELTLGQFKNLLSREQLDNSLPVSVRLPMHVIRKVVSESGAVPENDRNIISVFSKLI